MENQADTASGKIFNKNVLGLDKCKKL